MIEWNAENTLYFAMIITNILIIGMYFLVLKDK